MKDERVQEAFETIQKGVFEVYSSDNWCNYLKVLSRFHNYSSNNCLLIMMQCPEATFVSGATQWKANFHRMINKGEKAIRILAPLKVKKTIIQEIDGKEEEKEIEYTMFKTTNVFDISQTNGDELPRICKELKGNSEEMKSLIYALISTCKIPVEYWNLKGEVKGFYRSENEIIVLKKGMDDLATLKTLIHEVAHSKLHKDSKKSKEQKEIEAESIAYVVANYFDIDTSSYSFEYVASYSTNKEQKELQTILNNIQATAKEIINSILDVMYEKEK